MSGRDMIGKILILKINMFLNTNYFLGFFYSVEKIKLVLKKVWLKSSGILCPNICTKPVPRMKIITIRFQ